MLGIGAIAIAAVALAGMPRAKANTISIEAARFERDAARALPTIARLRYEGGGDWYANPSSLKNLLVEIGTRTGIPVADRPTEVGPADPDLSDHPYIYATGHGNMTFSDLRSASSM